MHPGVGIVAVDRRQPGDPRWRDRGGRMTAVVELGKDLDHRAADGRVGLGPRRAAGSPADARADQPVHQLDAGVGDLGGAEPLPGRVRRRRTTRASPARRGRSGRPPRGPRRPGRTPGRRGRAESGGDDRPVRPQRLADGPVLLEPAREQPIGQLGGPRRVRRAGAPRDARPHFRIDRAAIEEGVERRLDPAATAGHLPHLPRQVVPGHRGQVGANAEARSRSRRSACVQAIAAISPASRASPAAAARQGVRRTQRDRRGHGPGKTTPVGSPSRYRRRASASSPADRNRLLASFSRHFMQTAFSSRPTARSRSRGQSGSSSRTRRMTTAGFAPAERRRAGQQREQGCPQAVDVDGRPDVPIAPGLLGRHVLGRAHRLAGHAGGLGRLQRLAQAQVDQVRPVLPVHHDIRGLDVAVHDAAVVGVLHGPGDRLEVGRGPTRVERPALADHPAQAPPVDQPHREEQPRPRRGRPRRSARCDRARAAPGPAPRCGIATRPCGRWRRSSRPTIPP